MAAVSTVLPLALLFILQADPAPPAAAPPPAAGPPPAPVVPVSPVDLPPAPRPHAVAFAGGAGYRLGDAGDEGDASVGFVFDVLIATTYYRLHDALDLGLEVDFAFERYARTVGTSRLVGPGEEVPFKDVRKLMHYDVALMQTLAHERGRVRAWLGGGGGLDIGYFQGEEIDFRSREHTTVRPLVRAGGGVDIGVRGPTSVGLRVDWARPLRAPSYAAMDGTRITPFGDRLLARLTLRYRF